MSVRVVAAVVVVSVGLSACSTSSDGHHVAEVGLPATPQSGVTSSVSPARGATKPLSTRSASALSDASVDAASTALPLDAYSFGTDSLAAVDKAQDLLVADCMKKQGFTVPPSPSQPSGPVSTVSSEPYGITNANEAAVYGYQNVAVLTGAIKFAGRRPAYMTDAYLVALQGWSTPPADGVTTPPGCEGNALSELLGGPPPPGAALVGELAQEASQRTEADPRVVSVYAAWSACMASHGFSYGTPQAATGGAWPPSNQLPSAAGVATAVADVACKVKTNLAKVWLEVDAGYQTGLIEQNTAVLGQVQENDRAELARADRVIARHGSQ